MLIGTDAPLEVGKPRDGIVLLTEAGFTDETLQDSTDIIVVGRTAVLHALRLGWKFDRLGWSAVDSWLHDGMVRLLPNVKGGIVLLDPLSSAGEQVSYTVRDADDVGRVLSAASEILSPLDARRFEHQLTGSAYRFVRDGVFDAPPVRWYVGVPAPADAYVVPPKVSSSDAAALVLEHLSPGGGNALVSVGGDKASARASSIASALRKLTGPIGEYRHAMYVALDSKQLREASRDTHVSSEVLRTLGARVVSFVPSTQAEARSWIATLLRPKVDEGALPKTTATELQEQTEKLMSRRISLALDSAARADEEYAARHPDEEVVEGRAVHQRKVGESDLVRVRRLHEMGRRLLMTDTEAVLEEFNDLGARLLKLLRQKTKLAGNFTPPYNGDVDVAPLMFSTLTCLKITLKTKFTGKTGFVFAYDVRGGGAFKVVRDDKDDQIAVILLPPDDDADRVEGVDYDALGDGGLRVARREVNAEQLHHEFGLPDPRTYVARAYGFERFEEMLGAISNEKVRSAVDAAEKASREKMKDIYEGVLETGDLPPTATEYTKIPLLEMVSQFLAVYETSRTELPPFIRAAYVFIIILLTAPRFVEGDEVDVIGALDAGGGVSLRLVKDIVSASRHSYGDLDLCAPARATPRKRFERLRTAEIRSTAKALMSEARRLSGKGLATKAEKGGDELDRFVAQATTLVDTRFNSLLTIQKHDYVHPSFSTAVAYVVSGITGVLVAPTGPLGGEPSKPEGFEVTETGMIITRACVYATLAEHPEEIIKTAKSLKLASLAMQIGSVREIGELKSDADLLPAAKLYFREAPITIEPKYHAIHGYEWRDGVQPIVLPEVLDHWRLASLAIAAGLDESHHAYEAWNAHVTKMLEHESYGPVVRRTLEFTQRLQGITDIGRFADIMVELAPLLAVMRRSLALQFFDGELLAKVATMQTPMAGFHRDPVDVKQKRLGERVFAEVMKAFSRYSDTAISLGDYKLRALPTASGQSLVVETKNGLDIDVGDGKTKHMHIENVRSTKKNATLGLCIGMLSHGGMGLAGAALDGIASIPGKAGARNDPGKVKRMIMQVPTTFLLCELVGIGSLKRYEKAEVTEIIHANAISEGYTLLETLMNSLVLRDGRPKIFLCDDKAAWDAHAGDVLMNALADAAMELSRQVGEKPDLSTLTNASWLATAAAYRKLAMGVCYTVPAGREGDVSIVVFNRQSSGVAGTSIFNSLINGMLIQLENLMRLKLLTGRTPVTREAFAEWTELPVGLLPDVKQPEIPVEKTEISVFGDDATSEAKAIQAGPGLHSLPPRRAFVNAHRNLTITMACSAANGFFQGPDDAIAGLPNDFLNQATGMPLRARRSLSNERLPDEAPTPAGIVALYLSNIIAGGSTKGVRFAMALAASLRGKDSFAGEKVIRPVGDLYYGGDAVNLAIWGAANFNSGLWGKTFTISKEAPPVTDEVRDALFDSASGFRYKIGPLQMDAEGAAMLASRTLGLRAGATRWSAAGSVMMNSFDAVATDSRDILRAAAASREDRGFLTEKRIPGLEAAYFVGRFSVEFDDTRTLYIGKSGDYRVGYTRTDGPPITVIERSLLPTERKTLYFVAGATRSGGLRVVSGITGPQVSRLGSAFGFVPTRMTSGRSAAARTRRVAYMTATSESRWADVRRMELELIRSSSDQKIWISPYGPSDATIEELTLGAFDPDVSGLVMTVSVRKGSDIANRIRDGLKWLGEGGLVAAESASAAASARRYVSQMGQIKVVYRKVLVPWLRISGDRTAMAMQSIFSLKRPATSDLPKIHMHRFSHVDVSMISRLAKKLDLTEREMLVELGVPPENVDASLQMLSLHNKHGDMSAVESLVGPTGEFFFAAGPAAAIIEDVLESADFQTAADELTTISPALARTLRVAVIEAASKFAQTVVGSALSEYFDGGRTLEEYYNTTIPLGAIPFLRIVRH